MGHEGVYFDLLDWLDRQEHFEPSAFLLKLQSDYGAGAIIYVDGAISSDRFKPNRVLHSRPSDAGRAKRLLLERPLFDQLLRVFSALEPVQIELAALSRPRASPISAGDAGTAAIGVGYPLLSRPGQRACLLVQSKDDFTPWPDWRRQNDRDVLSLAIRFHARMMKAGPPAAQKRRTKAILTRRECETLAWIAAGKSYWEAAIILGITERTVRYFMANARHKLDVVNNAQAVAEAVWQGLIPRLSDGLHT